MPDEDELLATIEGMSTVMPEDWSPDERFIVFRGLKNPAAGFDLWALPLHDLNRPAPVVDTEFEERDAQISPDGTIGSAGRPACCRAMCLQFFGVEFRPRFHQSSLSACQISRDQFDVVRGRSPAISSTGSMLNTLTCSW